MPILQNPRHERFAQELASGKTQGEAYIAAGYRDHRGNAAALFHKQDISERVAELLDEREHIHRQSTVRAIEETGLTKAAVIQMLIDDRVQAYSEGQTAAAVRAAELLGKELGMFIDRKEVKRVDEFESMGEAELRAYIVEGLGLAAKVRGTRH